MNIKTFTNGLVKDNPVFYQMLGMCPTLAVTTSAENGMGMGLATTAVLVLANIAISILKPIIPSKIRIPIFIVVIASFVTIVGMVMEGYLPGLFASLGLFIPLIVVNCLILARAEAFAFKNGIMASTLDGLGMGLGFTLALTILGSVREIFGAGAIFGKVLFPASFQPALIMILPPGAFLALGLLLAGINVFQNTKAKKAEEKRKAIEAEERRLRIEEQRRKEAEAAEKKRLREEAKKKKEEEKAKAEAAAQGAEQPAGKTDEIVEAPAKEEKVKEDKSTEQPAEKPVEKETVQEEKSTETKVVENTEEKEA